VSGALPQIAASELAETGKDLLAAIDMPAC
jgi:hypothetical protein